LLQSAEVEFASVASQLTAAAKIGDTLVAMNTAFVQAAQAQSNLTGTAALTVSVDQSTDADRIRSTSADLQSEFSADIDSLKLSGAVIDLTTAFTLDIQGGFVIDGDFEGADAEFALTAEFDIVKVGAVDAVSEFAVDATADRIRDTAVSMTAFAVTLTAVSVTTDKSAALNSNFGINITADRIRTATVDMQALVSQLTVANETNSGEISISSAFTISTVARVIRLDDGLTYRIAQESRSRNVSNELRSRKINQELRYRRVQDN
jgi:hypothetical protein